MDKIILYQNDNGDILQATDFEPIDREELTERLAEAQSVVRELQSALERFDKLSNREPETYSSHPALTGEDDGDGHVKFKQVSI